MRIEFSKSVELAEDVSVSAVTNDHTIIYPGSQIVLNNKGGFNKNLPMEGWSEEFLKGYNAFMALLASEAAGEYEDGAVTARIQEKRAERQALVEEAKAQVEAGEV